MSTDAVAETPRSSPSNPRCSVVVALTETHETSIPAAAAISARMESMCGRSGVDIAYRIAMLAENAHRPAQELARIDAAEFVGGIRKVQAYVAERGSSEKGIADGVYEHVTVRMCNATLRMRYLHPAYHKPQPVAELMYVIPLSYAESHMNLHLLNANIRKPFEIVFT